MYFTRRSQAAAFCLGKVPQPDDTFVNSCGFVVNTQQGELALIVRRVIGECGSVDPTFIHGEDRWPEDLAGLDFYDSIDYLHFALSIEQATGRKLRHDEKLRAYFSHGFIVSDLVRHVVEITSASQAACA